MVGLNYGLNSQRAAFRFVFRRRTSSVQERRRSLRGIGPITHLAGLSFGWVGHEAECGSEGQIIRLWVLGEVEGQDLRRLALLREEKRIW